MVALKWLRFLLTIPFVAIIPVIVGYLLWGRRGITAAIVVVIIAYFLVYWYGDRILMRWYRARLVGEGDYPYLYAVLRKLASSAGIPVPRLALAPVGTPNIFSAGKGPGSSTIVLTYGLLRVLDSEEIEGAIAHEIAHIINNDTPLQTLVSVICGSLLGVAYSIDRLINLPSSTRKRRNPNDGLLLRILTPIVGIFLHVGLSPSREYFADEHGARISGKPLALASALLKLEKAISFRPMRGGNLATSPLFIVNPFRGDLADMVSTHPPTKDRAERLLKLAEEMGIYT
ncbi:M48 family metalloprotease [Thermococcus sp. MAR1]|uniref:M48 family metalloprotease n=1 Tax=Thermococcus sp. MAR1 TaxID=1638263 RepID=UPI00143AD545|nr:M48 family metalloprotease [Thermococcus sp. MAR1]NJE10167.1 protease [Thermococcus sp. MAR1]